MRGRYPWWGDSGGYAPTSSGSVAEGVSSRAPPWIPHRGAVRRGRGGYASGCGTTTTALPGEKTACVLPVKKSMVGWPAPTSSGSVADGVTSRAPPWIPHAGCGKTGDGWVTHRRCGRTYDFPRLSGVCSRTGSPRTPMRGRYPWWGDSGGTAPTSSGSVAEGVSSRAPPWIPHRGAARRQQPSSYR